MKRYRLVYDKTFVSIPSYNYKGIEFEDLAICFECKILLNGEEMLFSCGDDESPQERKIYGIPLDLMFNAGIDDQSATGYSISETKYAHGSIFSFEFVPKDAWIWKKGNIDPVKIGLEEASKLLKRKEFHNSDNKCCQTVSFGYTLM